MPLTRVRELYVADLSEMVESEQQMLRELPVMAARATDPALRDVFDDHYRETQQHLARLLAILERLDERPRQMTAPAMRGLIEESWLRQGLLEKGMLLDFALIDAARRMEHYEIAGYATIRVYARRLGDDLAVRTLEDTLKEEQRLDDLLGTIAEPPSRAA
jgi:ferritin-like metal-binding protein YciE